MKKILADSSLVLAGAAIVVATVVLANLSLMRTAEAPATAKCDKQGTNHLVMIQDDTLSMPNTVAKLCDTLTIMNNDSRIRIIAFGQHDQHVAYDGVTEQVLAESQSFTVVMNKLGTYTFHDHTEEAVAGTFTVQK